MSFSNWRKNYDSDAISRALIILGIAHRLKCAAPFDTDIVLEAIRRAVDDRDIEQQLIVVRTRYRGLDFNKCPDASALLAIWQQSGFQYAFPQIRVEVQDPFDAEETCEILAAIGTRYPCYWRVDRPRLPISWKWPIRFGFLGESDESRELDLSLRRVMTGQRSWAERIASTQIMSAEQPECDVLIATGAELSLSQRDRSAWDTDVLLVPVASQHSLSAQDLFELFSIGRRRFRCSAILLQPFPSWVGTPIATDISHYVVDLIGQISHAVPFDVAVHNARASQGGLPVPYLLSSHRFLNNSAINKRMANYRKILANQPNEFVVEDGSDLSHRIGGRSGLLSLNDLSHILPGDPTQANWFRETAMATTMSEIVAATADEIHKTDVPRFLQAKVSVAEPGSASRSLDHAFERGREHLITVLIGPPQSGWLGPGIDGRFPDENLDAAIDENELQIHLIVLHEPFLSFVKSVILPRRGASSSCQFKVALPIELESAQIRLAVTFRGRVLQSAMLRGPVREKDVPGPGGSVLRLDVEAINVASLDSLHERSRFDSVIFLNHTDGNQPLVGVSHSNGAFKFGEPTGIDAIQEEIAKLLGKVGRDRNTYVDLFSNASQKLIWQLAVYGTRFRKYLETVAGEPLGERIQVMSVEPDRRLPLEICYDAPLPPEGSPTCSHAVEALTSDGCSAACPYHNDKSQVLCPLNFWGLNRVIERHVFNKPEADKLREHGARYEIRFKDDRPRSGLKLFERTLCGFNSRVEKFVANGEYRITNAFSNFSAPPFVVRDWDSWKAIVGKAPSLLLAIGHVAKHPEIALVRRMELGKGSWQISVDFDGYVRPDNNAPQPIVLLFACEASDDESPLMDFVASVREAGAAIIVTTNCVIDVEHAVDLAERFIPLLHSACINKATVGVVMRDVRRAMVASGNVMPLCLTAFGDADWILSLAERASPGHDNSVNQPVGEPGGESDFNTPVVEPVHDVPHENEAEEAMAFA